MLDKLLHIKNFFLSLPTFHAYTFIRHDLYRDNV